MQNEKILIKMNNGDVIMGTVVSTLEDKWVIKKPYSVMMLENGLTIAPIDISILQSEKVADITLFEKNIQYFSALENFEMYYNAYIERTNTIIGAEQAKIIV